MHNFANNFNTPSLQLQYALA